MTEIVNAFREVAEAFNLPKEEDITEAQLAASKPITAEERRAQLQQSREEGDHDGLRNGSDATIEDWSLVFCSDRKWPPERSVAIATHVRSFGR